MSQEVRKSGSPEVGLLAFRLVVVLPGCSWEGMVTGVCPPVCLTPALVTLARHCGHGLAHFDLLLGVGARCPTIALISPIFSLTSGLPDVRTSGRLLFPHRRRYLSFSGPVPGRRGVVSVCFQGRAIWHRTHGGLRVMAR
jgi:hypothetical protein